MSKAREILIELNPYLVDDNGRACSVQDLLRQGTYFYKKFPQAKEYYGEDGWAYLLGFKKAKDMLKVLENYV